MLHRRGRSNQTGNIYRRNGTLQRARQGSRQQEIVLAESTRIRIERCRYDQRRRAISRIQSHSRSQGVQYVYP